MRKIYLIIAFMLVCIAGAQAGEPRSMTLYDKVVFYDGYNDNVFDAGLDDGILRHRNSLYSRRLTDEQMEWFGTSTTMNVTIGALCDNYDRIGNITLALVPKGEETYDPFAVQRLELGRFITPFMDKNKDPREVPYTFVLNHLGYIFHDAAMRELYDYWIEFELFGIPYAANEQIDGCKGCNDVFEGTLEFVTSDDDDAPALSTGRDEVLVPIVMKKPEYIAGNLNNYSEAGTDTIGQCTKTYTFEVPEDVADGQVVLIISNHGANAGGEEYTRRLHLVYFDGEVEMSFKPGGVSCEPYRVYNTQLNGIYGTRRSDSWWEKNSNWCPGAAIPVRYMQLGAVKAGIHKVMIRVPWAYFADKQGDFPVSMYFQGLKQGQLPSGVDGVLADDEMGANGVNVSRDGDILSIIPGEVPVTAVKLISASGATVYDSPRAVGSVDMGGMAPGVYILYMECADGSATTFKVVR